MIIDLIVKKVKKNFIEGLISTGCNVEDIGLSCLLLFIFHNLI